LLRSCFSIKLGKQTKNCTDIFERPIKILGADVLFRDGRKPEAQEWLSLSPLLSFACRFSLIFVHVISSPDIDRFSEFFFTDIDSAENLQ